MVTKYLHILPVCTYVSIIVLSSFQKPAKAFKRPTFQKPVKLID